MRQRFEVKKVADNDCDIDQTFKATHGRWYVTATPGSDRWGTGYLHNDLSMHGGTLNYKTYKYSGWFKTREKAERAVRRYKVRARFRVGV